MNENSAKIVENVVENVTFVASIGIVVYMFLKLAGCTKHA